MSLIAWTEACRKIGLLQIHQDQNNAGGAGKRQGDALQDPTHKRRAAFGDITNVSQINLIMLKLRLKLFCSI